MSPETRGRIRDDLARISRMPSHPVNELGRDLLAIAVNLIDEQSHEIADLRAKAQSHIVASDKLTEAQANGDESAIHEAEAAFDETFQAMRKAVGG